ncbi:hypothetical protein SSP24_80870 [Streptomyces spinoverrucosus]|uniref:Uncharacterized protein n=1 Tax=Streptomyces spinoverrucosus TaxID=284043 RepID=A0A4Y3VTV2_9ACTN|nr:hypothetical protein [Streptomyces spinoverrucosus]GEC10432.1 hypothetical protein SSP24_80870 [Streptomyces spinoverrucosus]GHB48816.1 hypothetical protein GCM10010397_18130 [Streptomyces spinoverrucosus]
MTQNPSPESDATLGTEARLSRLEAQVATLAEAVRVLARGLENIPSKDVPPEEAERGARLAHEILLSQGL